MNNTNALARLKSAAKKIGIELSDNKYESLLSYLALFQKWNKAYNLSAVRNPDEMLSRHIIDSLSVVPYFEDGENYIDVGTGGGLPGIVLAICYPDKKFTLLDSNGKKTRFLFQVKIELNLDNVTVVNDRVEAYQPPEKFIGVVSRAFASLADMTNGCAHLLADGGHMLAMKGVYPEQELSEMAKVYKVIRSHELVVPECDGQRHLLIIQPSVTN